MDAASNMTESPCQACGACCAYSANWPRFSTEDDEAIERIPAELVNTRGSGMRCDDDRCAALSGRIGEATACSVYAMRPEACLPCTPGAAGSALGRGKFRPHELEPSAPPVVG